jgi:hypothetical protein
MIGMRSFQSAIVLACLVAVGCKGDMAECATDSCNNSGDNGTGTMMDNTPAMTPPPNGNVTVPDTQACKADTPINPGATSLQRLTPDQYNSTVRDLLGDTSNPADKFNEDMGPDGAGYWAAAKALGLAASTNTKLIGCDPAAAGCADTFIANFGLKAFRRPLTTAETTRFKTLFTTVGGGAGGIDAIVEAMLMSADFHYRPEFGASGSGTVKLTSYEMATRLSYLVLGSMPDDQLFAAAKTDQLQDKAALKTQAERLMADPRAHEAVARFHDYWLALDELAVLSKDTMTVYKNWNDNIRAGMLKETQMFMDNVFWSGTVGDIFTKPVSFMDQTLADFYGVTGVTGNTFGQVTLDGQRRLGLLTQGGFLALNANYSDTNPVKRGKFVRVGLMCEIVAPPPPGAADRFPVLKPNETTRQRFQEHEVGSCAACHVLMDPIGLAFENYDGIAQWRDMQQNQVIDASGEMRSNGGTDISGKFTGPAGLAPLLAQSNEVKACLAARWFQFTQSRPLTDADSCNFKSVMDEFSGSGYALKSIVPALTQSDSFLYRNAVTPGGG